MAINNTEYTLREVLTSNIGIRTRRTVLDESDELLPIILARLGHAKDQDVIEAYCRELKLSQADNIPNKPLSLVNVEATFLKVTYCFPVSVEDNGLTLAMVDPTQIETVAAIEFATGLTVERQVIGYTDFKTHFSRLYGELEDETEDLGYQSSQSSERLADLSSDAPIVAKVEALLTEAVDMSASDIHVEPAPNASRIRFRVDGAMTPPRKERADLAALLASRVKVMCNMDVADRRRPQDGRTSVAVRGRPIDLRVSTVPTANGESLAIRILDRSHSLLDLDELGFSKRDETLIKSLIDQPKGIVLVTGPTGSGKTTTLYAALNRLRQVQRKILTIEDPVEYYFDDINQVQVNEAAGVSFASALRSFLRQDPDIMMVGEIRDAETARIAVQAALTGHLVLSTLHTNDAISAIARLKDMGIEDYLIAATVSGITAQRLVKKTCQACAGAGCATCHQTGQKGRLVISEGFRLSGDIAEAIRGGATAGQVEKMVRAKGFVSLEEDGLAKVARGLTTKEDVYIATGQA